jgi:hypothetical protein
MFENRYDIAYKLVIAAFILMALYSMLHPAAAYVKPILGNGTIP